MAYFWQAQVRFCAEGGAPERFISLAAGAGVPLWNTTRRDTVLIASCAARHYRALRPVARRSGMRLRVRRRWGLPFLLRPVRSGLFVGLLLASLLVWYLSGGIWVVRVTGNHTVPTAEILQVLEPLGIRQGGRFSAVDIPTLQLTALQRLPAIGWLTVNQSGSVVTVEVKEKPPSVPVEDTAPANVVATRDGVVVSVSVTRGQATVKVGDAVTAGSLLISGVTDSPVGPLLRRAGGSVRARVTFTLTAEVPLAETVTVETPVLRRSSVYLFGLTVPLYTNTTVPPDYTPHTAQSPLTVGDMPLPAGVCVTTYTAPRAVPVTRTAEQAAALAAERLTEQETVALDGAAVESRTVTEQRLSDRVILTGTYVCVMEIGRTEKIT